MRPEIEKKINNIERRSLAKIQEMFPIEVEGYTIDVENVTLNRPDRLGSLDYEVELKDLGGSLTGFIRGNVVIKDDKGKTLSRSKERNLVEIPYLTDRGTYLIRGSEKTILHQMRLKPGVYTYAKKDSAQSFVFLKRGKNLYLDFEPETANLSVKIDGKTFNAITLFRILGISDSEISSAINNPDVEERLFAKAIGKDMSKDIQRLWEMLPTRWWRPNGKYPGREEAIADIHKYFFTTSEFGDTGQDVMEITLGYANNNPDKEVFLRALNKIIRVGIADSMEERTSLSDDMDDIRFQDVLSDEDHIAYQIEKGVDQLITETRNKLRGRQAVPTIDKIPVGKLAEPLNTFMVAGSLVNMEEQTNPLHLIGSKRKVTKLGEGGVTTQTASKGTRNLQSSAFGRLDPVETPESDKIGLVNHFTKDSVVKNTTVYSRYYKVQDGKFTASKSNEVELAPIQEFNKRIAFNDPNTMTRSGGSFVLPQKVSVRHQGKVEEVDRSKVDYVDISPHSVFGYGTNLIPFSAHNDGNRMLMGSNMQKQALNLINREVPLVSSAIDPSKTKTYEQVLGEEEAFVVKSLANGVVSKIDKDSIVVKDSSGKEHKHELMNYFPLNASNFINNEIPKDKDGNPLIKVGDKVKKGQLLAEGWQTKDGALALGLNARIAFMPWHGYNFEDGVVISRSFQERMVTEEMKEVEVTIRQDQIGGPGSNVRGILSRLGVPATRLEGLDSHGVIKEGSKVGPGTYLVGIVEEVKMQEESPELRLLRAIGTELEKTYKDRSEIVEGYLHGTVSKVKILPGGEGNSSIVKIFIIAQNKLKEGDKIAGRHGNKSIITRIEDDADMPKSDDGKPIEIIFSPLAVPTRKNLGQLYETHAGLIAEKTGKPYKVFNFDKNERFEVEKGLESIGMPDGKMRLLDPETGKPYENPVTVGNMYVMKLKHKVDDKLQARTFGKTNYLYNSPVKSLGERAGEKENPQRWGEMEMRALQASKAVNLIDEAIKLKADAAGDKKSRREIFDALAFGTLGGTLTDERVPESLKLFKDYTYALGLNVKPLYNGKERQTFDQKFNELLILPNKNEEVLKFSNGKVESGRMYAGLVTGDKAEEGGLFDPEIFGSKDDGGAYRTRWGHIELATPMPNPVLMSSNTNPYTSLLGISDKALKSIVKDRVGVIIDPGNTSFNKFEIVELDKINEMIDAGKTFKYELGGNAIEQMLRSIDLKEERRTVENALFNTTKPAERAELYKKMRIIDMLDKNDMKPEDLMMKYVPVLPAGLRPFETDADGRQIIHDMNFLYSKLLTANERAESLNDPEKVFVTEASVNHKKVEELYKSLEALTGVNTVPVTSYGKNELQGALKQMKGKDGLIRGRMLSKFLDYSGRSVITVNPALNLDQAGLPVDIAKKLYQPFVIRELFLSGAAKNQYDAVEKSKDANDPDTWKALEKAVESRPIVLNRAPSLHKYSLQAFRPVLTKSRSIEINPLVVTGFNADFDGDQMGVHLPLTLPAIKDAEELLLPSKNLINPTNGNLITPVKGEAILGIYYLTSDKYKGKKLTKDMVKETYSSHTDLWNAYKKGDIATHDIVMLDGIIATVGQHLFNNTLPQKYRDYNRVVNEKELSRLISEMIADDDKVNSGKSGGIQNAVISLNKLKDLGFYAATKSALSVSIKDLTEPKNKKDLLGAAEREVKENPEKLYGAYLKVQEAIENDLKAGKILPEDSPFMQFMRSGAKGSPGQFTKMTGMVGLGMDMAGNLIPVNIKSSHLEGLTPAEFWVHSFDSRRGMADRALSTAEPGTLTRLVWSSTQDAIITVADCGDVDGIHMDKTDRNIIGRFLAKDIRDGSAVVYRRNTLIDQDVRDAIQRITSVQGLYVRSPISCKAVKGVCQKCYGTMPGTLKIPMLGEPVGILASQAIGEPTAQGTMKTFHGGGVSGKKNVTQGFDRVQELFNMSDDPRNKSILSPVSGTVTEVTKDVLHKKITIEYTEGKRVRKTTQKVPLTKEVLVKPGDVVSIGDRLTEGTGALAPREIMEFRGLEEAQMYVVNELENVFDEMDSKIDRKHIELSVGKMTDKVIVDRGSLSPWLPGQIVTRNEIESWNTNNANLRTSVGIDETVKLLDTRAGKTYKDTVGNVVIREGEDITDNTISQLRLLGVKRVDVYPKRVNYTPTMFGVKSNPRKGSENWFSQMGFEDIKEPLVEGAVFGKVDALDDPRSRTMAGKLLNIGSGFNKWIQEARDRVGGTLPNLFNR